MARLRIHFLVVFGIAMGMLLMHEFMVKSLNDGLGFILLCSLRNTVTYQCVSIRI